MNIIDILNEDWNGIERESDLWCKKQAELLEDYLDGSIDTRGLIAFLTEMATEHQDKAEFLISEIMLYLFKIKYSTSNNPKKHWRAEILNRSFGLRWLFRQGKKVKNRDLLNLEKEILDDALISAKEQYARLSLEYPDLKSGLDKLPEESYWSIEELISFTNIDSLLSKMPD